MNEEPGERDDLSDMLNAWANRTHVVHSGNLRTQVQLRRSRLRARNRSLAAVALIGFAIAGSWIAISFRADRAVSLATRNQLDSPIEQSRNAESDVRSTELETLRREVENVASQIQLVRLEVDLQIQSEALKVLRRNISATSNEIARDDICNSIVRNWIRQQQIP